MSRVASNPVMLPSGVEIKLDGQHIVVKGARGTLELDVHDTVEVVREGEGLTFVARTNEKTSRALAGTMRALVNNMVVGVSEGFEKKLVLQGVGYRAQAEGKQLNMRLGFSHPVEYQLPDGIDVQTPTQTEIVVSGISKQLVGQISAEIRSFRPPEPYKGKGVRYAGERVRLKEAKKT
ncbi:MAG: 50S ribosomal protein L6 [Gammaproteobacteria bacterium]|nr:50S ribosomal protein L6 [Gammaproteobacteria bacterium]MCZ6852557.1 50S ribosomal protein L6 [Gammaproteobacteria bacterium]